MNPATEFFCFEFQGDIRGPDENLLKEVAGLGVNVDPIEEEPGESNFGTGGDVGLIRPRPDLWFLDAWSHAHEEDRQAAETLRQALLQVQIKTSRGGGFRTFAGKSTSRRRSTRPFAGGCTLSRPRDDVGDTAP